MSNMQADNVLNHVVGYVEAAQLKDLMEQRGTDFREDKGRVQQTINQLHPKRLSLRVTDIFIDTPSTKTLRVESTEGYLPPFQAGQYINLYVNIDGVETARPYAISSPPHERRYYDLTVKRAEGGFVSHYLLDRVSVDQPLTSSGPMGTFHHNPLFHGNDLVFFAGGSGIAPARSMARHIVERQLPYRFHIIYSSSFEDDVIFAEEIRGLARQHDNIRLTEIISRPSADYSGESGRLTVERIKPWLQHTENKMYYICGPTPFNDNCVSMLSNLGVRSGRIMVEANGAPKNPHIMHGWPEGLAPDQEVVVTVKGHGSFVAQAGEPLLNSLERNGFSAENACRSGECSLCRIKLIGGTVFNPPESKLRKSDRQFGWIHSCVAFPVSDIEIQLG